MRLPARLHASRHGFTPNFSLKRFVTKSIYEVATKIAGGKMVLQYGDEWRHEIEDYFRPGNMRVAERLGIDLGPRGYAV